MFGKTARGRSPNFIRPDTRRPMLVMLFRTSSSQANTTRMNSARLGVGPGAAMAPTYDRGALRFALIIGLAN